MIKDVKGDWRGFDTLWNLFEGESDQALENLCLADYGRAESHLIAANQHLDAMTALSEPHRWRCVADTELQELRGLRDGLEADCREEGRSFFQLAETACENDDSAAFYRYGRRNAPVARREFHALAKENSPTKPSQCWRRS